jgi:hypothetical protein
MKRGVKINNSEMEPKKKPSPNSCMKIPVSMGLRTNRYGPTITSFGGGLNGTGVPLALTKYETERSMRNNPNATTRPPAN